MFIPHRVYGFIQLPLTGWLMVAFGAVVLILGIALKVQTERLGAEKQSHATTKAEYASFKAETRRLGEEAQKRARAEIVRQKQVNQRSKQDYEKRIADIASAYQRLLGDNSGGRGMREIPDTARPTNDAARDQRLLEVLRHADEQTARLQALQQWVRDQLNP